MRRDLAPQTPEDYINQLSDRMRRVEMRVGGGGGGVTVTISPDEPAGAATGSLWFDTDAYC